MASAARLKSTSNTKSKQKLSQSRLQLNTPQKTTSRNSVPSTPSATATKSKTSNSKSKPNQSILSFFKKISGDEDGLFIGGEEVQGEDIYEATPPDGEKDSERDGDDRQSEGRYNEAGGPVKRRRLSPGGCDSEVGEGLRSESEGAVGTGKSRNGSVLEGNQNRMFRTPAAVTKRKAANPFLDDSSSDREDHDDNKENEPKPATSRVRSPPPTLDDCDERDSGPGPAKLTNGGPLSRDVPLLRQQTSGTELGGDVADIDDAVEDDDFTGEELEAMRYMEEQARLEAEEEGGEYEASGEVDDESMVESCPVCNGSLGGATPDQAAAHVNSCLDGNPTPLPNPPDAVIEAEAAAVGKRFAKAAVARPGQANPISLGDDAGEGTSNSAFTKLMSGHAEDAAWASAAAAETASRGMPAYKRTCPFYKFMPGFFICVDAFRYGAVEGCKAYFLSHFHSDHYMGLTANWTHGPIYCSKVTGSLVKSQLKTAAKYVVELEFEETVPVPETNGVTVTMIPANHCPGSSLFLFEKTTPGRTQRILHCGDFRACPAHVEHPKLRPETVDAITGQTKQQKIDVCYLDTTYLNPRYSFPPQHEVITACAELCALLNKSLLANDDREWESLLRRQRRGANSSTQDVSKFFTAASPSSTKPSTPPIPNAFTALTSRQQQYHPNRLLVVCGTYSIGKERICIAIAKALRTKIYATPAKIRMCKQLDDAELASLLTSDPAEAQVHMQMIMEIRAETLADYLEGYKARGEFGRVVGFRPSGWNYRPSAASSGGAKSGSGGGLGIGSVGANLPPSSLPTAQLLHGLGWKTKFAAGDLVPQRGSSSEAMCFGVPYSEHSSFRELALFVMALRIERVVPTVNVGSEASRRRMKGWIERWVGERRRGGLVRVFDEKEGEEHRGEGRRGKGELWDGKDGRGGGVYW
ncbi:DRMBL-domain-containing protein [Parathielavia appendiculata]|uniref:DRMBL-domain-containing protein n=1 Tax=Parathielavia appendiculata TaxID=2587402 RepID=A0AAN6U6S8_9PEZI|nr:DRMBL-domain-containing protein [Parathielavia appendiculata]